MFAPSINRPPRPFGKEGFKPPRPRRQSICAQNLEMPMLSGSQLEHSFRFLMHLHYQGGGLDDSSRFIPDDLLISTLLAGSFLEVHDLVTYCARQLVRFELEPSIILRLPLDLREEIFACAPLTELVSLPSSIMTEDQWKLLCERHFNVQTEDGEIPNASFGFLSTPIPSSPHPGVAAYVEGASSVGTPQIARPSTPWSPEYLSQQPRYIHPLSAPSAAKASPSPTMDVKTVESSDNPWRNMYLTLCVEGVLADFPVNSVRADFEDLFEVILGARRWLERLRCYNEVPEIIPSLASAVIRNCPKLEVLDVSKCSLSGRDAKMLLHRLQHSHLKRLLIGNNRLGFEGTEALANFLSSSQTLKTLHAEHCSVAEGITQLSLALRTNKSLEKLSLAYNHLRYAGTRALAEAFIHNHTLKVVDLGCTYMGDSGIGSIAHALKFNRTLTVLRLWDRSATPTAGDLIVEALETNHVVHDIGLGLNALTDEAQERLQGLLQRNRTGSSVVDGGLSQIEDVDPIEKRRKREISLLYGADSVFSDTWYLMAEQWLSEWRAFVSGSSDAPPGPIKNNLLVDTNGDAIPGLQKLHDYRGVTPEVWRLFHELYGGGPAIVRSRIDLYSQ